MAASIWRQAVKKNKSTATETASNLLPNRTQREAQVHLGFFSRKRNLEKKF